MRGLSVSLDTIVIINIVWWHIKRESGGGHILRKSRAIVLQ